jgi:hypothetical protein
MKMTPLTDRSQARVRKATMQVWKTFFIFCFYVYGCIPGLSHFPHRWSSSKSSPGWPAEIETGDLPCEARSANNYLDTERHTLFSHAMPHSM